MQHIVDLSERLATLALNADDARRTIADLNAVGSKNAQDSRDSKSESLLVKWSAEDTEAVAQAERQLADTQREREDLQRTLEQLASTVVPALQVRAALATTRATWALVFFTVALIGATIGAAVIAKA